MYCVDGNPRVSGDFLTDTIDFVDFSFEPCSDKKLKCWSSKKRQRYLRNKIFRIIGTKNFIE